MAKRIFLFLLTNLFIIFTISIVTSLLGLKPYLHAKGINYTSLAIFCALWGTGGAFVSLLMSKWIAKRSMSMTVINRESASKEAQALLDTIYQLSHRLGLTTMPEVAIYDSPELNAFATGPTKKKALVAVSTGLLAKMKQNEVSAVLGHEISHVANGDMVTMTMLQGIINAFALFLSRIIAYAIAMGTSRSENESNMPTALYYVLTMVFDIIFTLLGSIVVAAFSRWREYRADAGGAKLTGRDNMIAALRALEENTNAQDNRAPSISALKISAPKRLFTLFASHPSIDDRIKRLESLR